MRGHNSLELCMSAICEAIEYWANETVFKGEGVRVVKVEPGTKSYSPTFVITITSDEDPQP